MSDIKELTDKIIQFREERDWGQFHNPKDLAISLVLEAGEVLEHFQWKNDMEIVKHLEEKKGDLSEELADTLYWILLMCHDLNIDIKDSLIKKIEKNAEKYPVIKSKSNHTKYTDL
jgi:NTP pyrophosphatase (non-canonical NTP hydrolase)